MRILHVLDHSIPLHSGYTFRTAALLREQRALGWETFHLTSPKQGLTATEVEDVDGLRFYRSPVPAAGPAGINELRLMRATEARLGQLARELRPDILHAHSPVLNVIPAIRVGKRLGIPVVYEIRAFWEDAAVDHGTTSEGSLRYRFTRGMETWALKRVDHAFTICEGLRRDIVGRGIPEDRVTVIPNAVDVEAFQLSGEPDPALRQKLDLGGKTVLGFVGSFYAYEGLDLLLEAFPRLLEQRPELRVLLVGGGPQDENLKAQARRLGVADKVIFTGRVPHAEVSRYYDQIDLLVYPRHSMRLTELVTPLKPLEAMAQGRIFVASDVGGHKELIEDGKTGRLFRAGDASSLVAAVDKMLDDRDTWPAMRAAGRLFVEEVRNWRNSTANYVDVYKSLVPGRGADA
ncbi:MAG: glycosyltransferase, exosortase A system-associated [Azoarcus sp.]|jgi:PEP-CTERM/exosortase A-associated glycosyltransferase|nr:glycosyltransferase, exosortase A system-associated [Azoarcus sp.]